MLLSRRNYIFSGRNQWWQRLSSGSKLPRLVFTGQQSDQAIHYFNEEQMPNNIENGTNNWETCFQPDTTQNSRTSVLESSEHFKQALQCHSEDTLFSLIGVEQYKRPKSPSIRKTHKMTAHSASNNETVDVRLYEPSSTTSC